MRGSLYDAAAKLLKRKKWKRIGIERNRLTFGGYSEIQEKLDLGAQSSSDGGSRRAAADDQVGDRRSMRFVPRCKPTPRLSREPSRKIRAGMTETDLAAELEYQMRRLGAEKPSFETIVAAGVRTALPHAQPTTEKLHKLLLVDMGCVLAGYASDMTRMLHLGNPGSQTRKLYKAVLEAQLAAIDAVRAGIKAGDVDRAARRF